MVHRGSRVLLFLCLLTSFAWAQKPAAPARPLPTLEQVLERVLAKAEQDIEYRADLKFAYRRVTINEDLDAGGNATSREEREYETVMVDGRPFRKLVRKNGKALQGSELEKEIEREQKVRNTWANRAAKKSSSDDELQLNRYLVDRYAYALVGTEAVNGKPAYVLTFRPKGKGMPDKKRYDKILNRLTGRVWIDEEDYSISRIEMYLTEPAPVFGFLATIRQLAFNGTQTEVAPGVWMPEHFRVTAAGRKLFSNFHVRQEMRFFDYKPLALTAQK